MYAQAHMLNHTQKINKCIWDALHECRTLKQAQLPRSQIQQLRHAGKTFSREGVVLMAEPMASYDLGYR